MEISKKSIAVKYSDVMEMIKFCKDAENNVSKEFYDWYLSKHGKFFIKTGTLIIDFETKEPYKYHLNFNFNDVDNAEFEFFGADKKFPLYRFSFVREDNLTMANITAEAKFINDRLLKKESLIFTRAKSIHDPIENTRKQINSIVRRMKKNQTIENQHIYKKALSIKKVANEFKTVNSDCVIEFLIYGIYATMFYVSINGVNDIDENANQIEEQKTETPTIGENIPMQKIKTIYKYTGYVDIGKPQIFKPVIKRDKNEPIRDYERHIESWTVRGHYRRTPNGLKWIDEHIKGNGELEQRIYSTSDKKSLNLNAKIFEVEKNVPILNTGLSQDENIVEEKPDVLIIDEELQSKTKLPSDIINQHPKLPNKEEFKMESHDVEKGLLHQSNIIQINDVVTHENNEPIKIQSERTFKVSQALLKIKTLLSKFIHKIIHKIDD
jgi:hypothetical protein